MNIEILLFEVDDKRFGVPTERVKEVVRAVKLSPLPQASGIVEGLLNLRGRIVPVIDVRTLFGMTPRPIHYTDHLIVAEVDGRLLTLRVDRATDLVQLSSEELEERSGQEGQLTAYAGKIGEDIAHVLDVGALFALPEAILFDPITHDTEMPT